MSVLDKLATALGRRDEVPNVELAKEIAAKNDKAAVKELVATLQSKNKDIQFDCIKTLYEIGYVNPALIADYAKDFIVQLDSKNNRMQWGAMTALSGIVSENPKAVYAALGKIAAVAEKGTVITKDHYAKILTSLGAIKQYADDAFTLLIALLQNAPTNQLPKYAENAVPLITEKNKPVFIRTLTARLGDFDAGTKLKRLEKVLQKVTGLKG